MYMWPSNRPANLDNIALFAGFITRPTFWGLGLGSLSDPVVPPRPLARSGPQAMEVEPAAAEVPGAPPAVAPEAEPAAAEAPPVAVPAGAEAAEGNLVLVPVEPASAAPDVLPPVGDSAPIPMAPPPLPVPEDSPGS
eukprot:2322257-Alexandrium_andersonii.AAC.1